MKIVHRDREDNLIVSMTRGEWLVATGLAKKPTFSPTDPGVEAEVRDTGGAEVTLKRLYEYLKELFPEATT